MNKSDSSLIEGTGQKRTCFLLHHAFLSKCRKNSRVNALNKTSSVQKKEGMGWRKPKREPYYRSDRQAGSRYEQSINAHDGTSLIRSFYTESGMSLLRHAAFSAFRPSACISLVVLIYIVKCSIIIV